MSPVSDAKESTMTSEALATTLTAISTSSRGSDSNIDQMYMSQAQSDVGTTIGAVVPVIILLLAVAVLTLALVHLARKYNRVTRSKEMRIAMAQNINALDIDMNSSDPSRIQSRLDSMESNAAYGGATVNQNAGNLNLYETIDTSAEDITQASGTIEIQNEEDITDSIYEYIEKADRSVQIFACMWCYYLL